MANAKQAQGSRTTPVPTRGRKVASTSPKRTLHELYARLEKTQPDSQESKRISAQIVDAIG